jgi:hypothetical protein
MAKKRSSVGSSPVDNLTYDVITIIHEKAKGLEAFDRYLEDAEEDEELTQILERTREQDAACIQELKNSLGRLLRASGTHQRENDEEDEDEDTESQDRQRTRKVPARRR